MEINMRCSRFIRQFFQAVFSLSLIQMEQNTRKFQYSSVLSPDSVYIVKPLNLYLCHYKELKSRQVRKLPLA